MAKKDPPAVEPELQTSATQPPPPHGHDFHAVEVGKSGIVCTVCKLALNEDDKAPLEARAEERGHVDPPRVLVYDDKGRPVGERRASIADHKAWICKCAAMLGGGALGQELTGAEYDERVERAMGLEIRNGTRVA